MSANIQTQLQIIHALCEARLAELRGGLREHHPFGAQAPQYPVALGELYPLRPGHGYSTGGVQQAQLDRLCALRDAGLLSKAQEKTLARMLAERAQTNPYPDGMLRGTRDRRELWAWAVGLGYVCLTPADPAWSLAEELRGNPVRRNGERLSWKPAVSEADRGRWLALARRVEVQAQVQQEAV